MKKQIVIEIDETQYRDCIEYKNQKYAPTCKDVDSMFLSIANGTPLPKGHGRLIDADTYRKEMLDSREFDFFKRLDMQPTIIEADKE